MRSARSSSSQGGSRGNDSQRHCGRHRDQGKHAAAVAERVGQRREVRGGGEVPRAFATADEGSRAAEALPVFQNWEGLNARSSFSCGAHFSRQNLPGALTFNSGLTLEETPARRLPAPSERMPYGLFVPDARPI